MRSGQYKHLIDNLDQWAASFPNRPEVQEEKADVEQFRGLPDQRNGRRRFSTLRHDPGDWSVPVSINGNSATYLLDTGAWICRRYWCKRHRLERKLRRRISRASSEWNSGDPRHHRGWWDDFCFRDCLARSAISNRSDASGPSAGPCDVATHGGHRRHVLHRQHRAGRPRANRPVRVGFVSDDLET